MSISIGSNHAVNAWRERGYRDGRWHRNGGKPRTPLNATEAERNAYLEGYRHGARAREAAA